jgi:MFS family permease
MSSRQWAVTVVIFTALFIVGFALMGFEMLGSRYLNPYFGGGITTWASLISVVLIAMMIGYFLGGYLVDTVPSVELLCAAAALAGIFIMAVPAFADPMLDWLLLNLGDGLVGVLVSAFGLSFIPVALLSACSPIVVRLQLSDVTSSGKTTGLVYGISTLGNVAGTLFTTFYLIPSFGTHTITVVLGGILLVLYAAFKRLPLLASALLLVALLPSLASSDHGHAETAAAHEMDASFPEGSIWIDQRLHSSSA